MGEFVVSLYVLVLAGFLGFEVIRKVPPTLHTPLMSGANAISGITLIGALAVAAGGAATVGRVLAAVAGAAAPAPGVGGCVVAGRVRRGWGRARRVVGRLGCGLWPWRSGPRSGTRNSTRPTSDRVPKRRSISAHCDRVASPSTDVQRPVSRMPCEISWTLYPLTNPRR
jgi:NAD(P) transhydrogenase subunit alpha